AGFAVLFDASLDCAYIILNGGLFNTTFRFKEFQFSRYAGDMAFHNWVPVSWMIVGIAVVACAATPPSQAIPSPQPAAGSVANDQSLADCATLVVERTVSATEPCAAGERRFVWKLGCDVLAHSAMTITKVTMIFVESIPESAITVFNDL